MAMTIQQLTQEIQALKDKVQVLEAKVETLTTTPSTANVLNTPTSSVTRSNVLKTSNVLFVSPRHNVLYRGVVPEKRAFVAPGYLTKQPLGFTFRLR